MDLPRERFIKWEPTAGLPSILDAHVVLHDFGKGGGLHTTLAEPHAGGRTFKIGFVRELAFRLANESFRLKLLDALQNMLPWPAFTVENSEWIEWFHDQTLGAYRDWSIQHFLFVGEDVLEVLSTEAPTIIEIGS